MSDTATSREKQDVSIVLCGQAGQGIQTVEFLLTRILKLAGCNVFATKEYMSRVRGGANSTQIRVSHQKVSALVQRIDILVALDRGAIRHVADRLTPQTIVLAEKDAVANDLEQGRYRFLDVPFTKTAKQIGGDIYSNTVAAAALAAIFGIQPQVVADYVKQFFSSKSEDVVQNNSKAAVAGHKLGSDLADSGKIRFKISADPTLKDQVLLNGAQAVGLGAIAGGCNFISSYPMSPSTGVLAFLAKHAADFGIIAEQAEDEIAAINMAIGAWYAGARAMVTTSGGGFALMTEGLSLAGMLESPLVVHLAQRPGPATGLPTRTEQADLELALYAGHGEFPRAIFAPGTLEQAFHLTHAAFNLADKYQTPVFILTDQYLIDSYYNIPPFDLSKVNLERHVVETAADYRRYELTADGVSPRGVPGFGGGLVALDSDEHDEYGHITEDLGLRVKMVDKRLRKLDLIKTGITPPELVGPRDYKNLVLAWGSTCNIAKEALSELARKDTALLHYSQLFPLHPKTSDYLKRADRLVIIEGNATGQFAKLIKLNTGIDIDRKLLKYNGLSFSVEEVAGGLNKFLS
jgi:2-oxoglutarate ferredoxin oxidoreductase subunit alpha